MDQKRSSLKKGVPLVTLALCCIDSFLLDPFLLFLIGLIIVWINVRVLMKTGRSYLCHLFLLTLALFWSISISLYLNLPWTDWMAKLCGAENGRDWMLNSGVFNFEFKSPSEITLLISGFLFATYPLWLFIGVQVGYMLFGRKPTHKGFISLLSLRKPN